MRQRLRSGKVKGAKTAHSRLFFTRLLMNNADVVSGIDFFSFS
jgi:hypothetical protein